MKFLHNCIGTLLALAMAMGLAACGASPRQEENAVPEQEEISGQKEAAVKTLVRANMPEEARYDRQSSAALDRFTARSLPLLFDDLRGENRVCSPLNIYMALGMLAEITDGNSRAQVLDLLQSEDLDGLRQEIGTLWEASWRDDDWITSLPAASVWLRDGYEYRPEPLRHLAEDYYSSAFSGPMGTPETDQALRDWIDAQTKHLLQKQSGGLHLDSETVIALVTTLYFKAAWDQPFEKEKTEAAPFYALKGERDAAYMRRTLTTAYYRGEHCGAICLPMQGGAGMWLLLPDEDSSLQEIIDSGEAAAMLSAERGEGKRCVVHLSLPKFDVDADLSLIELLEALGVTDVFDPLSADFSPLTDEELYVSQVRHAARVKIDEEGTEAAAYTVIGVRANGALPNLKPEEIDFICERPFLFAVSERDLVLFAGAVNEPSEP